MGYPGASDFTSPGTSVNAAGGIPAWWTYTRDNGSLNACETTGASVVRHAQTALGLPSTATWDDTLQNALISKAQQLAAADPTDNWQTLISDLQTSLTNQQVSLLSITFAIWLAYYAQYSLRLDAISVPTGAILPPWGATLPDGSIGDTFVCFDTSSDPDPTNLSSTNFATAVAQSTDGIRLHPGESLPSPTTPVPPASSGLPLWALVLGGVVVTGLVVSVVMANRKFSEETSGATNRRPRDNPRSYKRRARRVTSHRPKKSRP